MNSHHTNNVHRVTVDNNIVTSVHQACANVQSQTTVCPPKQQTRERKSTLAVATMRMVRSSEWQNVQAKNVGVEQQPRYPRRYDGSTERKRNGREQCKSHEHAQRVLVPIFVQTILLLNGNEP